MILKVFMLIMLSTGYSDGGLAITTLEFSDLQECIAAKELVILTHREHSTRGKITAECYKR